MEAKEKAKELIKKYKPFVYCYMGSGMLTNTEDEGVILSMSKQCAVIAVDEIVKALEEYGQDTMELQNMDREFAWWDKVKQEINNLTI